MTQPRTGRGCRLQREGRSDVRVSFRRGAVHICSRYAMTPEDLEHTIAALSARLLALESLVRGTGGARDG